MAGDIRRLRNRPEHMPGKAVPYAQWPANEELRIWRVVRDLEETVQKIDRVLATVPDTYEMHYHASW